MKLARSCVGYRFDLDMCKQEFKALDKDDTGRLRPEELNSLYEVRCSRNSLSLIRIFINIF
jgi:hypothetical protein